MYNTSETSTNSVFENKSSSMPVECISTGGQTAESLDT